MQQNGSTGKKGFSWFWPALCLILAALLIYVNIQNYRLKQLLTETATKPNYRQQYPTAAAGTPAAPFEAFLPDGRIMKIAANTIKPPYILAWFSNDCEVCYYAREGWSRLAREFPGKVYALLKFPGTPPDSLFFGVEVPFQLLAPVDSAAGSSYQVDITPQTMLINDSGMIAEVWVGVPGSSKIDEIIFRMKALSGKEVK